MLKKYFLKLNCLFTMHFSVQSLLLYDLVETILHLRETNTNNLFQLV